MTFLASEDIQRSMQSIEDERAAAAPRIGRRNAQDIAVARLRLLLSEQQDGLANRPYGHGHAWNVWAVTVAIEQVRRSPRMMHAYSEPPASGDDADPRTR